MKKFSVIIPVHNNLNNTKICIAEILSSFQKHGFDHIDIPIVIIDDGSEDGTSEWINNRYPFIHLIKGDGNLWWSGGMNVGIKYSLDHLNVDYILLWNNDITPSPDYFNHVSQIINSADNHAIVCSMVYYKDKPDTLISTGSFFNRKTGKFSHYNYRVKESDANTENLQIDWFGGMGVLIRTDVFKDIGYFDDNNFPQYHGDSDFGLRATLAGYKIHLDQRLKVWNDTSHTGIHAKECGLKDFFYSFSSIKSNNNIKIDIKFYSKYITSKLAYRALFFKYLIYILLFIKRHTIRFFNPP